mmetsp:Transcript_13459/g.22608  ORF Transcript_13459/g.22608 Transcript_13459/m.22608 type:complete len:100 (-) Transcript_13459:932-1231(-)
MQRRGGARMMIQMLSICTVVERLSNINLMDVPLYTIQQSYDGLRPLGNIVLRREIHLIMKLWSPCFETPYTRGGRTDTQIQETLLRLNYKDNNDTEISG